MSERKGEILTHAVTLQYDTRSNEVSTYACRKGSAASCRGGNSERTGCEVLADFTWPFCRIDVAGLSVDADVELGRLLQADAQRDGY